MEAILPQLHYAISDVKTDIKNIAQDTHIDFLLKSIEPLETVSKFRSFSWFLSVKAPGSYILGDVMIICQKFNGEYISVGSSNEEVQYVFFPISSQHLLIGGTSLTNLDVDPENINRASASISHDFFIASQNTVRETQYQQDLGKATMAFQSDKAIEMTAIAGKYWKN